MFVLVRPEKCDHVFVGFRQFPRVENKCDWLSACLGKFDRREADLAF